MQSAAAFPRDVREIFGLASRILAIYSNEQNSARSGPQGDILLQITSCLVQPPKSSAEMNMRLHGEKVLAVSGERLT